MKSAHQQFKALYEPLKAMDQTLSLPKSAPLPSQVRKDLQKAYRLMDRRSLFLTTWVADGLATANKLQLEHLSKTEKLVAKARKDAEKEKKKEALLRRSLNLTKSGGQAQKRSKAATRSKSGYNQHPPKALQKVKQEQCGLCRGFGHAKDVCPSKQK